MPTARSHSAIWFQLDLVRTLLFLSTFQTLVDPEENLSRRGADFQSFSARKGETPRKKFHLCNKTAQDGAAKGHVAFAQWYHVELPAFDHLGGLAMSQAACARDSWCRSWQKVATIGLRIQR